jgi:hypothetical protein
LGSSPAARLASFPELVALLSAVKAPVEKANATASGMSSERRIDWSLPMFLLRVILVTLCMKFCARPYTRRHFPISFFDLILPANNGVALTLIGRQKSYVHN